MRIDLLRFNQAILLNLPLFQYHTWRMFRRNPGQLYCIRRPISSAASRSIFLVLVSAESCCLSWPPLGITLREGWCLKEGLSGKRLHQASCPAHIAQLTVRKKNSKFGCLQMKQIFCFFCFSTIDFRDSNSRKVKVGHREQSALQVTDGWLTKTNP